MIKIIKTPYILVIILMLFNTVAHSSEKIFIAIKINNEIVTNVDIKNEMKYLIALNPQLKTISIWHKWSYFKESRWFQTLWKAFTKRFTSVSSNSWRHIEIVKKVLSCKSSATGQIPFS